MDEQPALKPGAAHSTADSTAVDPVANPAEDSTAGNPMEDPAGRPIEGSDEDPATERAVVSQRGQKPKLKVALVISGAIALGSFESGVIRELTLAARSKDAPFVIDVIAGASAGAITAAQVAKVLLTPKPNLSLFELWKQVSLDKLTAKYKVDETSPLSRGWIEAKLTENLVTDAPDEAPLSGAMPKQGREEPAPPISRIRLLFSLTEVEGTVLQVDKNLNGIGVPVDTRSNNVIASVTLKGPGNRTQWERIRDLVLASSAHPAAWDAVQLSAPPEKSDFEKWLPESLADDIRRRERADENPQKQWFIDGGTTNNLPIGSILRQLPEFEKEGGLLPYDPYRIVLYVEPDPVRIERLPSDEWRLWSRTAVRALSLFAHPGISLAGLKWVGEANQDVLNFLDTLASACERLFIDRENGVPRYFHTRLLPPDLAQQLGMASPGLNLQIADPPESTDGAAEEPPAEPCREDRRTRLLKKRIDAFYQKLDEFDGAAKFKEWLDSSPIGETPSTSDGRSDTGRLSTVAEGDLKGNATRDIRDRLLAVARWYYELKQHGNVVQEMIEWHRLLAANTVAGMRQWVFVSRIVPQETPPLSRMLSHFGGFFHQQWMVYDYVLGRRTAIAWLKQNFQRSPYVQQAVMPPLPEVDEKEVMNVLAENAAALTRVMKRVAASMQNDSHYSWLSSKTLKWLRYAWGAFISSTATWTVGAFVAGNANGFVDWLGRHLPGWLVAAAAQNLAVTALILGTAIYSLYRSLTVGQRVYWALRLARAAYYLRKAFGGKPARTITEETKPAA